VQTSIEIVRDGHFSSASYVRTLKEKKRRKKAQEQFVKYETGKDQYGPRDKTKKGLRFRAIIPALAAD
jgi:hypothetical protein